MFIVVLRSMISIVRSKLKLCVINKKISDYYIFVVFKDKLHEIYRPRREQIAVTSNVGMDDLLAATNSLLTVDRINSEKERIRTASRLNKVGHFPVMFFISNNLLIYQCMKICKLKLSGTETTIIFAIYI